MPTERTIEEEVQNFNNLKFLNEFVEFEKNDKLSEHYAGFSFANKLKNIAKKDDDFNFENDQIIENFGKLDGEERTYKIRDLFYEKTDNGEVRRPKEEIDYFRNKLMENVRTLQPTATNYMYINEHPTQLTLSEYFENAKNNLNSLGALNEKGLIIPDIINQISVSEQDKFNNKNESSLKI